MSNEPDRTWCHLGAGAGGGIGDFFGKKFGIWDFFIIFALANKWFDH